jgi:hypothetical protein
VAGASKSGDQIVDEARAKAETAAAQTAYDLEIEMRYREIQLVRWQMILTSVVGAASLLTAVIMATRSRR